MPWCRGIKEHKCFGGVTHQHWPKRSQGGKEIVALLCAGAHDIIDNGSRFSNDVIERDGRRIYRILHEKRGILYERDIGASTGEGEPGEPHGVGRATVVTAPNAAETALPSPAGPSRVLEPEERVGRDSVAAIAGPGTDHAVTPPDSLDSWCQRGMALLVQGFRLQKIVVAWAFEVGDWWNEGETLLGQKVHQYDAQFSYWQLTKFASVAGRVPKESRRLDLSRDKDGPLTFEHYRVVAYLEPPQQRQELEAAVVNRESAAKLRARLAPPAERETHCCPECGAVHVRRYPGLGATHG